VKCEVKGGKKGKRTAKKDGDRFARTWRLGEDQDASLKFFRRGGRETLLQKVTSFGKETKTDETQLGLEHGEKT